MPETPVIYDLMLLLATSAPEDQRKKILSDVERAITSGGGTIERRDEWGTRALAYRIAHQADAEYHLLQFSGPPALIEPLSHDLKITDGVVRHRIIKVLPGTPPPPESAPPAMAAAPSAPAAEAEQEG